MHADSDWSGGHRMGAHDYQAYVNPARGSRKAIYRGTDGLRAVRDLAANVVRHWGAVSIETVADVDGLPCVSMVYEANEFVFEIQALWARLQGKEGYVYLSLRFAYCNPPAVIVPFCDMVVWLMETYEMECSLARALDPAAGTAVANPVIVRTPEDVRDVLVPSITYNRNRWQAW